MIILYLLLAVAGVVFYLYSNVKKKITYWEQRGITQIDPDLIYGNSKQHALHKKAMAEEITEFYWKLKRTGVKHGGFYDYHRPYWVPVDPALVKSILIKDFQNFTAHNPKYGNTLLFNNIFHKDGDEWKDIRRKLTPTFTSGKMKMMYNIILEKTNGLRDLVQELADSGEITEVKELLARYTTDIIGSCAFGIECDSLNDINAEFFQKGQDIFRYLQPKKPLDFWTVFLMALGVPRRLHFDLSVIEDFFRRVVFDTVKYREDNKIVRKDFLNLMIQLRNKGSLADIINEKDIYVKSGEEGISMEDVAGQCFLFFTAGFETSSTTMSFALLELSQNQDIQKKLREHIREILDKFNGELSYEALQEMNYLENVIHETLRKYPPLATLTRFCTKTYKVPESDIIIEKGTSVQIPAIAIQNDPEYFPEPEKFNPDRFNEKNKSRIADCTWLPFGDGPRQCLGLRFGMMQSKSGLAALISRFNFTLNSKTSYPPKYSPVNPILSVDGGIYLNVKEVK